MSLVQYVVNVHVLYMLYVKLGHRYFAYKATHGCNCGRLRPTKAGEVSWTRAIIAKGPLIKVLSGDIRVSEYQSNTVLDTIGRLNQKIQNT